MADPAYDKEFPPEVPLEDSSDPDSEKNGDLLNAILAAESTAYGSETDSALSEDRARAIDDYLGLPYGNEVAGRSQVVSRDVHDTVEWIKPSLLRIFTAGDEVARFDPVGPEDEGPAAQETDYINYVIQEKNPWFNVAYEWFTDALLTKNAYALAYWSTEKQAESERYEGMTPEELTLLLQDESAQLIGNTPKPDGTFDVVIRRTREQKGVKICVLPPERCLVAEDTVGMSVRDSSFFQYWEMVTISKLRSMGFDVPDDINDDSDEIQTVEDNARDQFEERLHREKTESSDPSMRKVRLKCSWIQFDYDGDGIAEHRMVYSVGQTVFYNDECSSVSVASIVPTPLPHRHPGLSVRDMVEDLQQIKTALLRGGLDNIYLQNNGRYAISDKVNVDDMLTSRPGGIVRVAGIPAQEILPFTHPAVTQNIIGAMEYIDRIREHRTGTNQTFTGVDPNALDRAHSGTAIAQLSSAAAQRVEMIARVFAEGVKELFLIVHELILKHGRQHKQEAVRLKNQWVPIDPSQWKRRSDMRISVGLGTGNKEQLMANLTTILTAQKEAIMIGVATPKNIYNALTELTKAAGFASPDKFWTEPQPPDPNAPKQPSPEEIKAQSEIAKESMKQEGEDRRKQMEIESNERIAAAQINTQVQVKHFDLEHAGQVEQMRLNNSKEVEFKRAEAHAKPSTVLQMDAGDHFGPFMERFAEHSAQQAQGMTQAVAAISEAAQLMAQAAQMIAADKEIVRDKSGKAVGTRIARH